MRPIARTAKKPTMPSRANRFPTYAASPPMRFSTSTGSAMKKMPQPMFATEMLIASERSVGWRATYLAPCHASASRAPPSPRGPGSRKPLAATAAAAKTAATTKSAAGGPRSATIAPAAAGPKMLAIA